MSELKVNKVSPRSGTNLTIGDSGDTTNIVGTLNNNGSALLSLANGVDNRVITSSSATALNGEANLTFDGSTLGVNGAAIFNDSGADKDFRVESDGNANMLFVDGGTNRVGIGTAAPTALLHVDTSNSGVTPNGNADELFVENSGNAGITIGSGTANSGQLCFGDSGDNDVGAIAYLHDVNAMRFSVSGTEKVRIHSNGVLSASAGVALGVGTASTASNVLDDYEEGTFTPTITAGLSSISYSAQIGIYTKIGDFVYVIIRLDASGTANSSRVEMGGLPFATKGSPNPGTGFNWSYVPAGVTGSTSTNSPILFVSPGSSLIKWYNTAGGNFVGSDLNNASSLDMYISGSYKVA